MERSQGCGGSTRAAERDGIVLRQRIAPKAARKARAKFAARAASTRPPALPSDRSALPTITPSHAAASTGNDSMLAPLATSTGVRWDGVPDAAELVDVDAQAGPFSGDQHGVGEPPLDHVLGLARDVPRGERRRVLHVDVGPDGDVVGAEGAPRPKRLRRSPLDEPLIGHARARMHVDANARGADDGCDGERRVGVVAQDVDPRAGSADTPGARPRRRPSSRSRSPAVRAPRRTARRRSSRPSRGRSRRPRAPGRPPRPTSRRRVRSRSRAAIPGGPGGG